MALAFVPKTNNKMKRSHYKQEFKQKIIDLTKYLKFLQKKVFRPIISNKSLNSCFHKPTKVKALYYSTNPINITLIIA